MTLAGACGKRGNPLPPLRPVPSRIADLTAHRTDDRIELRFTVPATNADGSLPLALTRVEIYRVAAAPLPLPPATRTLSAPLPAVESAAPANAPRAAPQPPPPPVNLTSKNLRATIEVVQPDSAPAAVSSAASSSSPATPVAGAAKPAVGPQRVEPGAQATFVDRVDLSGFSGSGTATARWSYVVVGVAGRNRRSTPSATVTVPLVGGPEPPDQLTTSNTDTATMLSWKGSAPGQAFLVFDVTSESAEPKALTPAPLTAAEYTQPVEFGQLRCFAVRALAVSGGATVESSLSARGCITAVDRYPPAAPANLQAIQEGAVITLNWTAVDAADLAGYIVLRGDASGVRLEPLMRTPVRGAIFRDTTVQTGATYVYSVYAADNAAVPNVSQQSNRQTVTVR